MMRGKGRQEKETPPPSAPFEFMAQMRLDLYPLPREWEVWLAPWDGDVDVEPEILGKGSPHPQRGFVWTFCNLPLALRKRIAAHVSALPECVEMCAAMKLPDPASEG